MEQTLEKPRFRGRLHQAAFWLSLPAGVTLVAAAQDAAARLGSAIYALSLSGLYGASAALHRIPWSPRALERMRRLDHSMIFVLIAGTYTPFALLVLPAPWSTVVLGVVWGGAALGIAVRVALPRLRAVPQTLYLVLGWVAIFTFPLILGALGPRLLLLLGGGLFYTVGAVLFLLRRPTLRPAVFGYHELWHVMVFAGSICHYALIFWLAAG
ncbi:MAG TPA: hemolysin III family protein [Actinomycetota bacterium]|nr:hemolysin III family protein [Actinomycetota bacterium]